MAKPPNLAGGIIRLTGPSTGSEIRYRKPTARLNLEPGEIGNQLEMALKNITIRNSHSSQQIMMNTPMEFCLATAEFRSCFDLLD